MGDGRRQRLRCTTPNIDLHARACLVGWHTLRMSGFERLRGTPIVRHYAGGLASRYEKSRAPGRQVLELAGARRGVLPDYLVIGAMKAGSTMFYEWLVTHPLVPPAVEKEVHFFDSHYRSGLTWYRARLPSERDIARRSHEGGRRALSGEATPNYLFHPLAPRRAHVTVPNAKLIVLLRNPVNRAYSHYQTNIRHDWEALTFEQALDREEERLHNQVDAMLMDESHHRNYPRYRWSYQAMGRYAELIERWLQYYPREQILFLLNEDLSRDPQLVFSRLWAFLDLPPHTLPAKKRRVVGTYSPMADQTRDRLRKSFRPHNRRLADLLGFDPGWD